MLTQIATDLVIRCAREFQPICDGRYTVRFAQDNQEVDSALRLRNDVFNVELGTAAAGNAGDLEFDSYDLKCLHLIVIEDRSGETVGTYRLNTIETAHSRQGFYSANEFTIEDLPEEILQHGIEIGRACVAKEHRNTRALLLLWKGLLAFLQQSDKRYYFGCCSIFSIDPTVGRKAYSHLLEEGFIDPVLNLLPCRNAVSLTEDEDRNDRVELPALFSMYLRIGALVCSTPMIDHEFGTTDFFVVFDRARMNKKYSRLFE